MSATHPSCTCACGHTATPVKLGRLEGWVHSRICEKCRKSIGRSSLRYQCSACQANICSPCAHSITIPTSPRRPSRQDIKAIMEERLKSVPRQQLMTNQAGINSLLAPPSPIMRARSVSPCPSSSDVAGRSRRGGVSPGPAHAHFRPARSVSPATRQPSVAEHGFMLPSSLQVMPTPREQHGQTVSPRNGYSQQVASHTQAQAVSPLRWRAPTPARSELHAQHVHSRAQDASPRNWLAPAQDERYQHSVPRSPTPAPRRPQVQGRAAPAKAMSADERVRFTDGEGDHIEYALENGILVKYVNGATKIGGRLNDGVVTQLNWHRELDGWRDCVQDQLGAFSHDVPMDIMLQLRLMADRAGVPNNLPKTGAQLQQALPSFAFGQQSCNHLLPPAAVHSPRSSSSAPCSATPSPRSSRPVIPSTVCSPRAAPSALKRSRAQPKKACLALAAEWVFLDDEEYWKETARKTMPIRPDGQSKKYTGANHRHVQPLLPNSMPVFAAGLANPFQIQQSPLCMRPVLPPAPAHPPSMPFQFANHEPVHGHAVLGTPAPWLHNHSNAGLLPPAPFHTAGWAQPAQPVRAW